MLDMKVRPIEALRVLMTENYIKRYNPEVLRAFIKVFKDPEKIKEEVEKEESFRC